MVLSMDMFTESVCVNLENSGSLPCGSGFIGNVQKRLVAAQGHPDNPATKYRASSIGKPWILQTLDRWYGGARSYTVSQCVTMMQGMVAGEFVAELLSLMGYKFEQELTLRYRTVTGHADIVVYDETGKHVLVLEVKSMGSHLIRPFVNAPHDTYGYMSQLSFYWECLRRVYPDSNVSAAFVLFDRGTSKITTVPLTETAMRRKFERIQMAVDVLSDIPPYDVDKLLSEVTLPPTVGGALPQGMEYSRWRNVLYEAYETTEGVRWKLQELDAISRQLKALPLQRKDLGSFDQ